MKNLHLEHPEDAILTGDLSVLDWFAAEAYVTAKIDGCPAIVWGTDPATGTFFVGELRVSSTKRKSKSITRMRKSMQTMRVKLRIFCMIALIAFLTSITSASATLLVMGVLILTLPTRSLMSFLK